jgi:hypothetical protein
VTELTSVAAADATKFVYAHKKLLATNAHLSLPPLYLKNVATDPMLAGLATNKLALGRKSSALAIVI